MSNDIKTTQKMLDDSLRRLDSEYIDLYMVHWPDEKVDIRRTLEVLVKAKEQQKILHIGLCNTNEQELEKAKEVCEVEVLQSEFSIFNHTINEWEQSFSDQMSFMSWGTFDKGILTGRVDKKREQTKNYEQGDCRKSAPWWNQGVVLEKIEKYEKLKSLWEQLDVTSVEGAMSFNLSHDFCDILLMGAKSINDWDNILDAKIKDFDYEVLNKIYEIS